jgi:OmpA-OmpF porin, OOP family
LKNLPDILVQEGRGKATPLTIWADREDGANVAYPRRKPRRTKMARTMVAPLLLMALVASLPAIGGCEAHAQLGSGAQPPPPPAPPPAAPPPTPAAATPAPDPAPAPAPAAEPPKSDVTVSGDRLGVPGNVVYETGKAVIKPESEPTLNALKNFMEQNKNYTRIRVEGHTDNVGTPAGNMKLSTDRAMAVVEWMSAHGLSKDRFLAVGFGDTKPIADNKTEDGKAQNRRTEFHLAEVNSKPFLGRDETAGGQMAPGQTAPPPPKQR